MRVDTDGKRIPFDRLLRFAKTERALLTKTFAPNIPEIEFDSFENWFKSL